MSIMKTLRKILAVSAFNVLLICSAQAQEKKIVTKEIHVEGVCDMCKKRIENAALIKGVKMAEWNQESGMLKVVYHQGKTSDSTICASIAKAGHDSALLKADTADYGNLPACCLYRDGVKKH